MASVRKTTSSLNKLNRRLMWQDVRYTRLCEDSKYLGFLLQIMNTSDTKLLRSYCSCDIESSSSFCPTFSKHTFYSSKEALCGCGWHCFIERFGFTSLYPISWRLPCFTSDVLVSRRTIRVMFNWYDEWTCLHLWTASPLISQSLIKQLKLKNLYVWVLIGQPSLWTLYFWLQKLCR